MNCGVKNDWSGFACCGAGGAICAPPLGSITIPHIAFCCSGVIVRARIATEPSFNNLARFWSSVSVGDDAMDLRILSVCGATMLLNAAACASAFAFASAAIVSYVLAKEYLAAASLLIAYDGIPTGFSIGAETKEGVGFGVDTGAAFAFGGTPTF